MSSGLAIAAVTAVLRDLLINGVIDQDLNPSIGDVKVTALPPDRVSLDSEQSQLNLFLYQASPNPGWQNVGHPVRNAAGERIDNPPLALDLHYLLTAYGSDELHADILLGYGMQLMHETPVLTRAAIRRSLAPPTLAPGGGGLPPAMQTLFTSELAEQVEQIKISRATLTTEELSKMWAAFGARYRPTAFYQASVVLIESRASTRSPLPVHDRGIYVLPFNQPVIERILSQEPPADDDLENRAILSGHNLVLEGTGLRGDDTWVKIGSDVVNPLGDATGERVVAPIPASVPAGVQGVQVIHDYSMGSPLQPHRGVESNVEGFVLRPAIDGDPVASTPQADVTLNVKPSIGPTQRVLLLLNEVMVNGAAPRSYTFPAPPRFDLQNPPASPPAPTGTITIPIQGVVPGTYLVRIQVDGAESPLGRDGAGRFDAPTVVIP